MGRAPDNDLVVDAPAVSRYHAEIRHERDGQIVLVDLHSPSGTFLNGAAVERIVITSADGISLGRTSISPKLLDPLFEQLRAGAGLQRRAALGESSPGRSRRPDSEAVPSRMPMRTSMWARLSSASSSGGVTTLGVFNIILGALGLLLPVAFWTLWRIDETGSWGDPTLLFAAVGSVIHQLVLFVGGLGLILRRPWGRAVSLIWAGISCAALLGAGTSAAIGIGPLGGSEIGSAATLVGCALLLAYPVLLLFLLNVPSYRRALWPRPPRQAAEPRDARPPDGQEGRRAGTVAGAAACGGARVPHPSRSPSHGVAAGEGAR